MMDLILMNNNYHIQSLIPSMKSILLKKLPMKTILMKRKLKVYLKKIKSKDNMEKVMVNLIAQVFLFFYRESMRKLMI